jgi:hypothetical protein
MKTWHLLLLGFMLAVASCRKVDISADKICTPLPDTPDLGWNASFGVPQVEGATFNPNNPREIVFVDNSHEPGERWLCILNTETHTKRYIYSGNIASIPSWGRNHTILFGTLDGNIHQIHENGDSLLAITASGGNWNPVWNVDGSRFGYRNNSSGTNYTYIFDEKKSPIDTLTQSGLGLSWNHLQYSPGTAAAWLVLGDTKNDSLIILETSPGDGKAGGGAIFIDDKTLVYSYDAGIYAIDIETRRVKVLRESCSSVLYKFPDYSPELNKLVWLKFTLEPLSYSELFVKNEIVLMNVDGGNEEAVELGY